MYWKRRFFENIGATSVTPQSFEISRAQGSWIIDSKGDKYLDFLSGFNVTNIGHSNEQVIRAINAQAQQYMHTTVYGEHIQSIQIKLAHLLLSLLPSSLDCSYFLSTGSEAIDAAIKLARSATGKSGIIACRNSYHGSTIGAESLRSDTEERNVFYPLLPDVRFINFGINEDLHFISPQTSCVIIEVIQAEAGVRMATDDYFLALRKKCDECNALLIFDEIQTGIGRTGKLFAFQHTQIIPDILLTGKALGAGLPLAALISSKNILSSFQTNPVLSYITTFGGNPVCCASAFAGLQYLLTSNLMENSKQNESIIRKNMTHSLIREIQGKGLFIAIELDPRIRRNDFIQKAYEKKLLLDGFLFEHNSLRIMPPLDISEAELNSGLQILLEILDWYKINLESRS